MNYLRYTLDYLKKPFNDKESFSLLFKGDFARKAIFYFLAIMLTVGIYRFLIVPVMNNMPDNSPPTSVDDMTNKQYHQFMKWQDKQDKQKWENQKVNK